SAIGVMLAALVALNWGFIHDFPKLVQSLPGAQDGDQTAGFAFMARVFGLTGSVLLLMIPLFILLAAYEAACLRWMIRGEAPGLCGLTLDADVWRVYGVYWCWFATQYIVSIAASFLIFPIMFASMTPFLVGAKPDFHAMIQWQLTVQLPLLTLQY